MAAKPTSTKASPNKAKSNRAVSYNEFKEYEGQRYTGMKIGRGPTWHYDQGDWKETKITPDLWQIAYAVTKRRAGRAPEGSGVPVGTEYHWYILAHQNVAKQTANDYTTSLTGLKFKIAHKRAGSDKWSATPRTQRKRMIAFLRSVLADLEKQTDRESASMAAPEAAVARHPGDSRRSRVMVKHPRTPQRRERRVASRQSRRATGAAAV